MLREKLAASMEELATLTERKAQLYKELSKAHRMQAIWPDCFGKEGKAELITTHLGDGHAMPIKNFYYLERMEDKERMKLTQEQYDYIKGTA